MGSRREKRSMWNQPELCSWAQSLLTTHNLATFEILFARFFLDLLKFKMKILEFSQSSLGGFQRQSCCLPHVLLVALLKLAWYEVEIYLSSSLKYLDKVVHWQENKIDFTERECILLLVAFWKQGTLCFCITALNFWGKRANDQLLEEVLQCKTCSHTFLDECEVVHDETTMNSSQKNNTAHWGCFSSLCFPQ